MHDRALGRIQQKKKVSKPGFFVIVICAIITVLLFWFEPILIPYDYESELFDFIYIIFCIAITALNIWLIVLGYRQSEFNQKEGSNTKKELKDQ